LPGNCSAKRVVFQDEKAKLLQMKAKQTIYTVAKALALSPSTVSKALRGSHEVSDAVRERVVTYCGEIGFQRRRFTPSRINLCAVVQRYHTGDRWFAGFVTEVLEGIADYTVQNGIEFSLYGNERRELDEMDLARELKRRHVNAAILVNTDKNCKYIGSFSKLGMPFYSIQGGDGHHAERVVKLENGDYTAEAVRVLHRMGHRRICLLAAGPNMGASAERRRGYIDTMMELFGDDEYVRVVEGHPDEVDAVAVGYHAAREILGIRPRPTAVISEGVKPPIGFVRACYEARIKIPEQLSILSIGNSPELESLVPSLTAIDVPTRELGELAARRLHAELLSQDVQTAGQLFPKPYVIMRESVAAPPVEP
jgi:DNA-binding LacI/PurR family transcriptional regulator